MSGSIIGEQGGSDTDVEAQTDRVHVRISGNAPKNLKLRGTTALDSAISQHLIDTEHTTDISQAFKIINK